MDLEALLIAAIAVIVVAIGAFLAGFVMGRAVERVK